MSYFFFEISVPSRNSETPGITLCNQYQEKLFATKIHPICWLTEIPDIACGMRNTISPDQVNMEKSEKASKVGDQGTAFLHSDHHWGESRYSARTDSQHSCARMHSRPCQSGILAPVQHIILDAEEKAEKHLRTQSWRRRCKVRIYALLGTWHVGSASRT